MFPSAFGPGFRALTVLKSTLLLLRVQEKIPGPEEERLVACVSEIWLRFLRHGGDWRDKGQAERNCV